MKIYHLHVFSAKKNYLRFFINTEKFEPKRERIRETY
jgi:hypothetical protein